MCISGNYFDYILNTTWANSFNWQKGGNFKLIISFNNYLAHLKDTNYQYTNYHTNTVDSSTVGQNTVDQVQVTPLLINILFLFQAFIIRQSSQSNTLALSVSEQDIIEHYLIEPSKQSSDKLSLESSDHSFDNVLSLVYHYSTTK